MYLTNDYRMARLFIHSDQITKCMDNLNAQFIFGKTVLVWIPRVKHPEIQKSLCFLQHCKV